MPLTGAQRRAICAALAALPSAYDQHGLDTSSAEAISEIVPEIPGKDIQQLLDDLRESGAIAPVLVQPDGDTGGPARVRWAAHI